MKEMNEELSSNEMLSRFDSVEALAQGFVETKSALGQSIRIVDGDAGEEARAEYINKLIKTPEVMLRPDFTDEKQTADYYKVLGVPDEAAAYVNPEGTELPEGVEAELRPLLHGANLTPAQYQHILSGFTKSHAETIENLTSTRTGEGKALVEKWGQAYESRIEAAKKVHGEFGTGEWEHLTTGQIEGLYRTSEALTGEPAQVAQQPSTATPINTPAEALQKVAEIEANPEYYDITKPERQKILMAKVFKLRLEAGLSDDINQLRAGQF